MRSSSHQPPRPVCQKIAIRHLPPPVQNEIPLHRACHRSSRRPGSREKHRLRRKVMGMSSKRSLLMAMARASSAIRSCWTTRRTSLRVQGRGRYRALNLLRRLAARRSHDLPRRRQRGPREFITTIPRVVSIVRPRWEALAHPYSALTPPSTARPLFLAGRLHIAVQPLLCHSRFPSRYVTFTKSHFLLTLVHSIPSSFLSLVRCNNSRSLAHCYTPRTSQSLL